MRTETPRYGGWILPGGLSLRTGARPLRWRCHCNLCELARHLLGSIWNGWAWACALTALHSVNQATRPDLGEAKSTTVGQIAGEDIPCLHPVDISKHLSHGMFLGRSSILLLFLTNRVAGCRMRHARLDAILPSGCGTTFDQPSIQPDISSRVWAFLPRTWWRVCHRIHAWREIFRHHDDQENTDARRRASPSRQAAQWTAGLLLRNSSRQSDLRMVSPIRSGRTGSSNHCCILYRIRPYGGIL